MHIGKIGRNWSWVQGPDSIKICQLTSIGNPIVEIRRFYDRLISAMGFPVPVRHLYIESGPRTMIVEMPQSPLIKHNETYPPLLSNNIYIHTIPTHSPLQAAVTRLPISSSQPIYWLPLHHHNSAWTFTNIMNMPQNPPGIILKDATWRYTPGKKRGTHSCNWINLWYENSDIGPWEKRNQF